MPRVLTHKQASGEAIQRIRTLAQTDQNHQLLADIGYIGQHLKRLERQEAVVVRMILPKTG
jgi:hypothetical protein